MTLWPCEVVGSSREYWSSRSARTTLIRAVMRVRGSRPIGESPGRHSLTRQSTSNQASKPPKAIWMIFLARTLLFGVESRAAHAILKISSYRTVSWTVHTCEILVGFRSIIHWCPDGNCQALCPAGRSCHGRNGKHALTQTQSPSTVSPLNPFGKPRHGS